MSGLARRAAALAAAGTVGASLLPATAGTAQACAGVVSVPVSVSADGLLPHDIRRLPPVPDEALARSVRDLPLDDATGSIAGSRIEDAEQVQKVGSATVVRLSSDILFEFGKADLAPASARRVPALVAKVPQGAAVSVGGHTDGVGDEQANLALSRARAQAVADAVRAARPDLRPAVEGFGESRPVEPEGGKDDAAARAKNRRVELRYG